MKGNPQSIFFIAVGVLLLNLGWSGRFKAVYEALRTGSTGDNPGGVPGGTPTTPGTGASGCTDQEIPIRDVESELTVCLKANAGITPAPEPAKCGQLTNINGLTHKWGQDSAGNYVCYKPSDAVSGGGASGSGGQAEMYVGMSLAQQMTPRWKPRAVTGITDGSRSSFFP